MDAKPKIIIGFESYLGEWTLLTSYTHHYWQDYTQLEKEIKINIMRKETLRLYGGDQ